MKSLLRYKPIVKADLSVNKTENINNFATDKELDLYNYGYKFKNIPKYK